MKILFVHQNFPGQFKHLAPGLVKQGHEVSALILGGKLDSAQWQGVRLLSYSVNRGSTPSIHPWVTDFETKVIRAEACAKAAEVLRTQGYVPDVIIAHPGWGESLFLKDIWPRARMGIYCEYFYRPSGADVGFDPEFQASDPNDVCRLRLKNLNNLLQFESADAGISPTEWQASTFPVDFRRHMSVIHDGIDTRVLAPRSDAAVEMTVASGEKLRLDQSTEVITFVNRNLEPYRGYHIFMRALPVILAARPRARVLIVGGDGVSYGAKPDAKRWGAASWKQIFINEVRPLVSNEDWSRVHFLGNLAYPTFVNLLQISTVHVYLTYPFVLSWSLLEAMSCGCAVVASDTQPVREVISDGDTGRLFNFFDAPALARSVIELLESPEQRKQLGRAARAKVVNQYDLLTACLPRQLTWVEDLVGF